MAAYSSIPLFNLFSSIQVDQRILPTHVCTDTSMNSALMISVSAHTTLNSMQAKHEGACNVCAGCRQYSVAAAGALLLSLQRR